MGFVAGYDAGFGGKPSSGMIEGFCQKYDLPANAVMVVGDNRHDMAFARNGNAGWAIGVLTGTGSRHDLEPVADYVLDVLACRREDGPLARFPIRPTLTSSPPSKPRTTTGRPARRATQDRYQGSIGMQCPPRPGPGSKRM